MNKHLEWFRIITPILVMIALFYAKDIRANVIKLEEKIANISDRLARVETKVDYLNGKRIMDREVP